MGEWFGQVEVLGFQIDADGQAVAESTKVRLQHRGDLAQGDEGDIPLASLDLPHEGAVDFSLKRQAFLRHSAGFPCLSNSKSPDDQRLFGAHQRSPCPGR